MSTERDPRGPVPGRHEGAPRLAWHATSAEEVAAYWQTNAENGLGEIEAAERIVRFGANRLPEAPPPPLWKRFVAQVSDFTVLALLAAALLAGLLALLSPL